MLAPPEQPKPDRKKLRPHNRTPIPKMSAALRRPAAARLLFTIQVQAKPEIKLPDRPESTAQKPAFKAIAIKEQTAGANNTAKNSGQRTRPSGAGVSARRCSPGKSLPQCGQISSEKSAGKPC